MSDVVIGSHFDIGARKLYEDRVSAVELTSAGGMAMSVALVADGVGGENKGERAAQLAKDVVVDYLTSSTERENVSLVLRRAVKAANATVHNYVLTMGSGLISTTLSLAVVHHAKEGPVLYIANVGDSRVYLCRSGKLTQLTLDHTFANIMPLQGKMSYEAAQDNPRAGVVMRALGPVEKIKVDVGFHVNNADYRTANERGQRGLPLREGDSVLVCSDGLVKLSPTTGKPLIEEDEIVRVLTTQEGDRAARSLVSFALGRDADDNVSAAIIQMPDPKRHTRAALPLKVMGAVAGLLVAFAIILIAFLGSRLVAGQETRLSQTATAESALARLSQTSEAQMAAATQTAESSVVNVRETESAISAAATGEAIAAAATAAAEQLSGEADQTRAASNAAATATAGAVALEATQIFISNLCARPDAYALQIAEEPELQPQPGTVYISGNSPSWSRIQASWTISNTGNEGCPWEGVQLRSVSGGGTLTPLLLVSGEEVESLPANSTAELVVVFPNLNGINGLDEEWVLQVQTTSGPLSLFDQPHILLQTETWVTVLQPTPTPSPTPTETPIPEPTSPPPPAPPSER